MVRSAVSGRKDFPVIGMPGDGDGRGPRASRGWQSTDRDEGTAAETAHDFGNLLQCATSALRVSQRYLRASGNEEIGSVIRVAEEALERATALAWRLAGVEQRYRTRKPISVPNAIFRMSNILHRAVGEHVKLEIKADECLPYVQCDVADLENAVLNLVVNAREAMPSGGRLVIRIGASQADSQSPKTGVLISVSDNGCGMATATAEQAFDRSFSTKGAGACRGLGLSSVQKFVCELGGSVELKTLPGQGTSVILKMPAACSLMDGGVQ